MFNPISQKTVDGQDHLMGVELQTQNYIAQNI